MEGEQEEATTYVPGNQFKRGRVLENISCPSCAGDVVIRTDSGRNRCQVCLEEWRR